MLAGCTLNSCVRVSALAARQRFAARNLKVVVAVGLCGARAGNYRPSGPIGSRSPVQAAVDQMQAAGVRVARQAEWQA